MTYIHSRSLGEFVFLYKVGMLGLKNLELRKNKFHSLIIGGIFGRKVFGL